VITDRDLAVEYARRYGIGRRGRRETAARFRERVVRELYAAGKWMPAEEVLLNEELTEDPVIFKGTLVPALVSGGPRGETVIREWVERTQGAFDQLRPRQGVLWLGRSWPRAVDVTIDLGGGRVPLADLTELIIDRIQAAVEQVRPRQPRVLAWFEGSRGLNVHVSFHPWRVVDHFADVPLGETSLEPIAERLRTLWPAGSRPQIARVYFNFGPFMTVTNVQTGRPRRRQASL
jgi:hypothetical protein